MPASLASYYGLGKGTLQTQKVDCRCALILGGLTETFSALSSEDIYPKRKRQNVPSCSRFFTQVHAPHDASQMRVAWFSRKSTIRFRFIRSVQGFMTSTRLSKISNRAEVPELGVFKRQKVRIFQLTALVLAGRRKGDSLMDSRSAKRFSPEIVEKIHRLFDDERVV